jgi:hypothetical protein
MLHFIWQFLTPIDQYAASYTCSQWYLYQQLRWRAILSPIAKLHLPRPPPGSPMKPSMSRALLYASALTRFQFHYGDFIIWLGGEYTNCSRDWDATFTNLTAAQV